MRWGENKMGEGFDSSTLKGDEAEKIGIEGKMVYLSSSSTRKINRSVTNAVYE